MKALIPCLAIITVPLLFAQTQDLQQPAEPSEQQAQPTSPQATQDQTRTGEASRTIPVVQPTQNPPYTPMNGTQRFTNYLKNSFTPFAFVRTAAGAGFGQWKDRPKEWGEGSHAFQKRAESGFAEHMVATTLSYGLSSAFGEDNRYLRLGEGNSNGARIGYALESSILARHRDGTRHFSYSKMAAMIGAALISRTWQPGSTRSMRSAGVNLSVMLASSAGFEVMREFLPDLLHRK